MITPEEKAKELIEIFGEELAIKCVDETLIMLDSDKNDNVYTRFWQEVNHVLNNNL